MFNKILSVLQLITLIFLSLSFLFFAWVIFIKIDTLTPVAIRELYSSTGIKTYIIATGDGSIGQCYIAGIFDKNPQANCLLLGNFKTGMNTRNIQNFLDDTKDIRKQLEDTPK